MTKSIRLKASAPPDSDLFLRVLAGRVWQPKFEYYGKDSILDCLLVDKENIEDLSYGIRELLECDPEDEVITWEIIDANGTVWSEEYDPDGPEEQPSARKPGELAPVLLTGGENGMRAQALIIRVQALTEGRWASEIVTAVERAWSLDYERCKNGKIEDVAAWIVTNDDFWTMNDDFWK